MEIQKIELTKEEIRLLKIIVEYEIKSFGDNHQLLKTEYEDILTKLEKLE